MTGGFKKKLPSVLIKNDREFQGVEENLKDFPNIQKFLKKFWRLIV